MRHTRWILALTAAGVLLTASRAPAEAGSSGATPARRGGGLGSNPAATTDHLDVLSGKVQRFDRSTSTLTVTGSAKVLKVDPATQVTKDGARASIDDIKEGEQVRASFSGPADSPRAQRIDITSSGATRAGSPGPGGGSSTR